MEEASTNGVPLGTIVVVVAGLVAPPVDASALASGVAGARELAALNEAMWPMAAASGTVPSAA